ncbi:hypothetical protein KY290_033396 [Solanum tuberosum]|uniref:Uncharacterized protein n=1 Tax=Solanum tuberosum TaxID=4113 RepID=A0ABQ7U0R2_SOLTU|nr:hypothetical protein KY289_032760 [Solanum tuberosum]KAH0647401.1 hypothetical protein KY285_032649 [Solanum tuberosum]KAH0740353.1 hypothetical protein KY290_033396 [Solanum tuberosum]
MKTVVHITNRLPQARLRFISPFEKLKKMIPTIISATSLIRNLFVTSLLDTTNKEKDGSVVTLPQIGHMCQEMWYLMKHHHGGLNKPHYQDSIELEQKLQHKPEEEGQRSKTELQQEVGEKLESHTKEISSSGENKSPWKTGIRETPEELQEGVQETPQLRRSTRVKSQNSKSINAALAEVDRVKEPTTFKEQ